MQFFTDLLLLASLLLITGVVAAPPSPDPAQVPLPPSARKGNTPPPGEKGAWTDDIGDTHAAYGNKPMGPNGGIPYHAAHVQSNQAKHPANAGLFPVNNDNKGKKQKLRDDIIGNKPSEPGMSRDHKPPNVQSMPGLTTEERKGRTTTKNLPTKESDAEFKLLGAAHQKANAKGATGNIQIHANMDPSQSRTSSRNSLNSLPPNQRPTRIPGPKAKPLPVSASPRRLRSGGPAPAPGQPGPSNQQQQNRPSTPPPRGQSGILQPGFISGTPLGGARRPNAPGRAANIPPPATPNTPTPNPRPAPKSSNTPSKLPVRPKGGKRDLERIRIAVLRRALELERSDYYY